MDPIKVSGVKEWKVPTNTTENCAFQGFTNFYHHFIPRFSKIAKPLNNLLKTGVRWHWRKEQQEVFEEIKTLIMSEPVLCKPDHTKPFEVEVEASNYASSTLLHRYLTPTATLMSAVNPTSPSLDNNLFSLGPSSPSLSTTYVLHTWPGPPPLGSIIKSLHLPLSSAYWSSQLLWWLQQSLVLNSTP